VDDGDGDDDDDDGRNGRRESVVVKWMGENNTSPII